MKTSSVDELLLLFLMDHIFGNKFDVIQAYGYVKYAATMWMLSMARKYPDLKFVVVSPGNTKRNSGTQSSSPGNEIYVESILLMPVVFPLMGGNGA